MLTKTEDGSTLVAALGVTAALAVLASAAVATVVSHHHRAALIDDRVSASEAVLSIAALALLDAAHDNGPIETGSARSIVFDDTTYAVTFWSPHGRVDLNTAPPALLSAAIRAANIADAETIADRIVDWRDPDELVSLRGAERAEYARAGLPPPGNRAFRSTFELANILGLREQDAQCLSQFTTVASLERAPTPALAPSRLQHALGAAGTPAGAILLESGTLIGLEIISTTSDLRWDILVRLSDQGPQPILIQSLTQTSDNCREGSA